MIMPMLRTLPRLAPALVLVAGCQAPPPPTAASPVQEKMFAHFALARDLRTFATNGDLERLRITAEELANEEPTWGMPPGSEEYREQVHSAARRVVDAASPDEAALAVAQVAAACGSCHLASDGTLGERFQVAAPLLSDPATRHTNYLSWVSRLLWDGLVGPSEAMWRTGAGALAGGDGVPAPRASYVPASEVERDADVLRTLGADAVTADDLSGRVEILANVWATCADCHVKAGVR